MLKNLNTSITVIQVSVQRFVFACKAFGVKCTAPGPSCEYVVSQAYVWCLLDTIHKLDPTEPNNNALVFSYSVHTCSVRNRDTSMVDVRERITVTDLAGSRSKMN